MLSIALSSVRPPMRKGVAAFKRTLRACGWELRRTDPDRSLGEHLSFLLPYLEVECVLDVGAGSGEYGDLLRQSGYTGQIISFEPVPESFDRLARRCADDEAWWAYPYALGGENGAAQIHQTKDVRYSSLRRPTERAQSAFAGCVVERSYPLDVRRLDDVLDDLLGPMRAPRVFLKVNTCGWDLDVLRGAERRLGAVVGLQSELSLYPLHDGAATLTEALAAFNRAGFAVSGMFDQPHHHAFRLVEVECVMTRPSGNLNEVERRW